jgi:hypothetical protein
MMVGGFSPCFQNILIQGFLPLMVDEMGSEPGGQKEKSHKQFLDQIFPDDVDASNESSSESEVFCLKTEANL